MGNLISSQDFPRIFKLTEKVTLVNDDLFIIEDSADSNKRKKVKSSNVGGPGGSSPLTTKGDLYGFDSADARLPVGITDGMALLVDSAEALGIKWENILETGTFTLELKFGASNAGTQFSSFTYVRDAYSCYFSGFHILATKAAVFGTATYNGLPFTSKSGVTAIVPCRPEKITFSSMIVAVIDGGVTLFRVLDMSGAGTSAFITDAKYSSGARLDVTGKYLI